MYNRTPQLRPLLLGVTLLMGCLRDDGGMIDTTVIGLSTGDESSSTSIGPGSTGGPGIMTTTFDTDHTTGEGSSSSAGTSGSSSSGMPVCGDGHLDEGEECDEGPANADDAACTSKCETARCGDGNVQKAVEVCDAGPANEDGKYDGCQLDCTLGPRCGDGEVQDAFETCDNADPKSGCLKSCQQAASCLEIKTDWQAEAPSGIYTIARMSQTLQVHCDMEADGGGYTFLKFATKDAAKVPAKQAEIECSKFGMRLLAPRTPAHLAALFGIPPGLSPVGGGADGTLDKYATIFGIYPVVAGQSCVGKPVNKADCPQWAAKDAGPYFVSAQSKSMTQPGTMNCVGCSMAYYWDMNSVPPAVTGYEAFNNGGDGATIDHFLCDPGDKQGP